MTPPSQRIVITSAGVVCSIGAGVEQFEQALYSGTSGLQKSTVGGDHNVTAEVRNFTPQQWLGNKGIRVLDRSARLLCVAAQMALDRGGLLSSVPPAGDPELGMICGTMFGGLHSIVSLDWSGLTEGPEYVNPMEFANTVINSPAGQAAIKFNLKGINSTVCAGLASGLYALHYGADALRFGRARVLLAGGVEELCEESIVGFDRAGFTARSDSIRPFQRQSVGTVLGEGAAMLMLETADSATARGARPLAEMVGFGCAHDAGSTSGFQARAEGATAAMQEALETAEIRPDQIGCIIASANGSRAGDDMEARALRNVFQNDLDAIPLSAPKAAFGEALGASGALCALAGAIAAGKRIAPPTFAGERSEGGMSLSAQPQPFAKDFVLVNAFSCDGNNAALVVKRWIE